MKSETPLDYAVFQLSPKCSRCELFVSGDGSMEKLASGLLKPFVAHLRIAEEQVASAAQSVKLEVGRSKNAATWFTKGTLERFVRFVSTPEVLELVNTFDAEMSQLEAARRIYSQNVIPLISRKTRTTVNRKSRQTHRNFEEEGSRTPWPPYLCCGEEEPGAMEKLAAVEKSESGALIAPEEKGGGGGSGVTAADDATKKELLRAIDVRLAAVQQDLSTACTRAAAAGFNIDTVSELQMFADKFGADRLNEACGKFISVSDRRPELINPCKSGTQDRALRSSCGSDMSIDEDPTTSPPHQGLATFQQPNPPPLTFPLRPTFSRESSVERDDGNKPNDAVPEKDRKDETSTPDETVSIQAAQPARRLSVQDRINLFENKQKENSGGKPVVVKSVELRRLSSDLSSSAGAAEKAVLRRWSGASDMSIDLSAEKKDSESPLCTSASTVVSQDKNVFNLNDETTQSSSVAKPEIKVIPSLSRVSDSRFKGVSFNNSELASESNESNSSLGSGGNDGLKDQVCGKNQSRSSLSRADDRESLAENSTGFKTEGILGFGDPGKLKDPRIGQEVSVPETHIAGKDQVSSSSQVRGFVSKGSAQFEIPNHKQDFRLGDESVQQTKVKTMQKAAVEPRVIQEVAGSKIREAFASHYKGTERDSSSARQEIRSVGETQVAEKKASLRKKESCISEKVSSASVSSSEDSGPQRLKFNTQGLTAELSKKARAQQDESSFIGNSRPLFSGKVIMEAQEGLDSFSTPPPEQAQRVRQSKGNQELNDELKIKASELEKLFAEHKLRVPGDQSNSARKGRSGDTQREPLSSLHYGTPAADIAPRSSDSYQSTDRTKFSKSSTKFNAASPMKTPDSQYNGDAINEKVLGT
ncbi:UNVERIFIED_CONTAM: COP1-interacting protein 7 [Sesamum calycinum]|uniref:COP1-interacting protein 7 n=1 Tax=Sesamum calycinum TaxID=2727403 RepID=A0AAW2SXR4_9LAMI